MDQGRSTGALQPEGLRERIASHLDSTGGSNALNDHGEVKGKDGDGKDRKTFGRTPDGKGMLASLGHSCSSEYCEWARLQSAQIGLEKMSFPDLA